MLPLALSWGDPSGIGPDIAIRAWQRHRGSVPPFYMLADPEVVAARARRFGPGVPLRIVQPHEAVAAFDAALPVVALTARAVDRPGSPDAAHAPAIIEAIDRAVADTVAGRAAAVVTCPIAKKPLYEAGFAFPGHTEYLAHLAQKCAGGAAPTPVMMLSGPGLRAVPVTIHIPLADVPAKLSTDLIVTTGRIVARDMASRFGIERARIAVAGLNPHAGENGAMGGEDIAVIAPAVRALRSAGIDAFGPLPADTMFHERARAGYDVALCMYHDQALIPAKALAFDETVNVTLGLPFVRTSPDHGTAFDIAGTGKAREDSLVAALRLAGELSSRQAAA